MGRIRLNLTKFDELCSKMSLSERDVARQAKFSTGTISHIRKKGGNLSRRTLGKIARVLKIPPNQLELKGNIPESTPSPIPVFSDWAVAGNLSPDRAIDCWIHVDSVSSDCFALKVRGDSMSPYFLENDLIILSQAIQARSGDFVVIKLKTEQEPSLKEIFMYEDRWALRPLNPLYSEIVLERRDFKLVQGLWVVIKSIRETIKR